MAIALGCSTQRVAGPDASTADAGFNSFVDVPEPTVATPADALDVGSVGEWISFRPEPLTGVIAPCGRGEPVSYFSPDTVYSVNVDNDRMTYDDGIGVQVTQLSTRTSFHLGRTQTSPIAALSNSNRWDRLLFHVRGAPQGDAIPKSVALISLSDDLSRGRIFWRRDFPIVHPPPSLPGGVRTLVATDRFVAFIMATATQRARLYVGGPNAEDLQPAPEGLLPTHARGEGDRMVFDDGNDIWLYTHSARRFENLTRDYPVQYQPWISGDHIVWVDLRHGGGNALSGSNPEIYRMDLRDRVPHRVTHDPADRPAIQGFPMIDGEWIVWSDKRHDAQPNSVVETTRSALYGWHLGTSREYVIDDASDGLWLAGPFVHEGWIYYACAIPSRRQRDSYYRQRLPLP